MYAYANVFKTTIIKHNIKIILLAGVPSSQALPGYLMTAPPSACVPDVIGALPCGFQTQKKKSLLKMKKTTSNISSTTKFCTENQILGYKILGTGFEVFVLNDK